MISNLKKLYHFLLVVHGKLFLLVVQALSFGQSYG
jgi:hypothetical protein